ncbi:hypothetical protein ACF044_11405 [Microbacterium sp. NPDC016588]
MLAAIGEVAAESARLKDPMRELFYCTPADALENAANMRTVGDAIEHFSATTFSDWMHQRLARRANWKKITEFTAFLMDGWRDGEE